MIVGLGNPGAEFKETYHNAGALALKAIATGTFEPHKKLFEYALGDGLVFVQPLIFMNESGRAVREAMKKFKAAPKDLVVLHDDSDLPLGAYQISWSKGAAGHKGVQSIMDALHTKSFTRVRIGIRRVKEVRRKKAEEFVLKKISRKDKKTLEATFQNIAGEMLKAPWARR